MGIFDKLRKKKAPMRQFNLDEKLSSDTLRAYLAWKFPEREDLGFYGVEQLLSEMRGFGICSFHELHGILNDNIEWFLEYEEEHPAAAKILKGGEISRYREGERRWYNSLGVVRTILNLICAVADEEHVQIVDNYFRGVSIGKIVAKLSRAHATEGYDQVQAHIRVHDNRIDKHGFCDRCRRLKGTHETEKTRKPKVIGDKFLPFDEAFETLLKSCALAVRYTAQAWAELENRKPMFDDNVKTLMLSCICKQAEKAENLKIDPKKSKEWKAYTDDKIEKLKNNSVEVRNHWELVKKAYEANL